MSDDARNLTNAIMGLGPERRVAAEPVSSARIGQFCDVIEDDTPIYRDPEAARRFGHPGQVAPPAMLHSWTLPPLHVRAMATPLLVTVREIFREHGYDAVIATNYTMQHHRYFTVGEKVVETVSLAAISERKETLVGTGHFLTSTHEFAGADSSTAATLQIRVFHFRRNDVLPAPVGRPTLKDHGESPRTTGNAQIPDLTIAITPSLIIAGAICSGDYELVHHDAALARSQGLQDIIMNILTTTGLVSRYVTDWAGPRAMLYHIALALKAPNYPNDRMTLRGEAANGAVAITGRNSLGEHVVANVEYRLEQEA
jgi:acyl dehydratase